MRGRLVAGVALVLAAGLVAGAAPAQAAAPNDGGWKLQYGPQQIGAPSAWEKSVGKDVVIAVVDSGVDVDHPEFKDKLVQGYDFADNDPNPDDDSTLKDGAGKAVKGHGTHVAGIAGALTNNSFGIAGVAPAARIMPLKVFPSQGSVLGFGAVPNAIRYAVDQGAKVINLSLGTFETGVSLVGFTQTACADAYQRGALCVVASGNSGRDNGSDYPRDYRALLVTANDEKGDRSSFGQKADSQWGVSAPGVAIYSTWPVEDGQFYTAQGTSMAAPHAAGAAALLFAEGLTNAQVVNKLMETARPNAPRGEVGAGIIDVAAALGQPRTADPEETAPPATPPPGPTTSLVPSGSGGDRGGTSSGGATTAPPSGAGETPITDPATTQDTKRTEGVRLAQGNLEDDAKGEVVGKTVTLWLVAAAGVAATGWYAGTMWFRQGRRRKLKQFV